MHVFLTGDRQVGKSTALNSVLSSLGRPVYGFRTLFVSDDGTSQSASLHMLPAQGSFPVSDTRRVAYRSDGRMKAIPGAFDQIGTGLLQEARTHPEGIILMDECGFLEKNAFEFQSEILRCLDGPIPVLGVLRKDQDWHTLIVQHPNVQVLEVTHSNRNDIPQRVIQALGEEPGIPCSMKETHICWTVNHQAMPDLYASPGYEPKLLLGYLVTHGYCRTAMDVQQWQHTDSVWDFELKPVRQAPDKTPSGPLTEPNRKQVHECLHRIRMIPHNHGIHTAILFCHEQYYLGQDISRHRAVDRALGYAVADECTLAESILVVSCRITASMIHQASNAGIHCIATDKDISNLAISEARANSIVLIHGLPENKAASGYHTQSEETL